jgi:hypothetical protein
VIRFRALIRVLLALLAACAAGSAAAQFCVKEKPWTCFSSMEVGFTSKEGTGILRMHFYANRDLMAELSGTGIGESKLLFLASRKALYLGVPDDEIKKGSPFAFFDYGFAYPILALQEAYPKGISAVPEGETDTPVMIDQQFQANIVVRRLSSEKIRYRIVGRENDVITGMEGVWEAGRKNALPDDFVLQGWKDKDLKTYATLGDARRSGP